MSRLRQDPPRAERSTEHDTLYPKASENVVIDLDDGVKQRTTQRAASRRIPGLEAPGDDLNSIQDALRTRLSSQRIVSLARSCRSDDVELDALDLEGITVVRVQDNEFGVKLHSPVRPRHWAGALVYRARPEFARGTGELAARPELAYGVFTAMNLMSSELRD